MPTIVRKPRPLLTEDDVSRWRNELQEVQVRIKRDQALMAVLSRKLEYAAFLTRDNASAPQLALAETPIDQTFERVPMTEAVPQILASRPRPMKPRDIRAALAAKGFKKEQLGNYFYTVLMRLSQRGTIIKSGARYTVPEKLEAADDSRSLNGSSTASEEHRSTSGGTPSGPVNPRPGGGT